MCKKGASEDDQLDIAEFMSNNQKLCRSILKVFEEIPDVSDMKETMLLIDDGIKSSKIFLIKINLKIALILLFKNF